MTDTPRGEDVVTATAILPRVGRYEILEALGEGAMGVVYKARDSRLDRLVALKTLLPAPGLPADARARFAQEAMAAGRLSHPNIVAIHDVVETGAAPYIVMEYVDGQTLADLIASRGALAPAEAVRVVRQVCSALEYAHAHGVVHRDIKPGNILVAANGTVKVGDFGIARIAGHAVTRTGVMVGTPAYMSPEQVKGRVVDERSDLFSLGVVLYEALAGVSPFRGDDPMAVLYQIVEAPPLPVRERNPAVSPALERVTERALAKEPDDRYPTAGALADALGQALDRPEAIPAPARGVHEASRLPPAGARRGGIPRGVLIGAIGLLAVGVAGWALRGWVSPAAPQHQPGPVASRGAGPSASRPVRGQPGASFPSKAESLWPGARPTRKTGSVVVTTNHSAEVSLDGVPKGRAGDAPLLLRDVATGDRLVTIRLGSREQVLHGTVQEGQILRVTYYFPEDPRQEPLGRLLDAVRARVLDEARDKLKEAEKLGEAAREKLRALTGETLPEPAPARSPEGARKLPPAAEGGSGR